MEPIRTWLDFALLQSVAESYLDGINIDQQNDEEIKTLIQQRLSLGNNHYLKNPDGDGRTKMTDVQARWFTTNYTIVDHLANTDSGLSATIFQNKTTGGFTLSFRSTEFSFGEFDGGHPDEGGDWGRDGQPGADGDIKCER